MESYNNSYALIMSHAMKKCAKLKPQMLPFFRETVWLINKLLAQVKHIVELLNIHLYVRFRRLEDTVLCKFHNSNVKFEIPFFPKLPNKIYLWLLWSQNKTSAIQDVISINIKSQTYQTYYYYYGDRLLP